MEATAPPPQRPGMVPWPCISVDRWCIRVMAQMSVTPAPNHGYMYGYHKFQVDFHYYAECSKVTLLGGSHGVFGVGTALLVVVACCVSV